MTSPMADGVLAATHKLVQQAMRGEWREVPKTLEQRRVLLDQLSANASPQDQKWLSALKQAMAESDAAVAQMTQPATGPRIEATVPSTPAAAGDLDHVASMMEMISKSR